MTTRTVNVVIRGRNKLSGPLSRAGKSLTSIGSKLAKFTAVAGVAAAAGFALLTKRAFGTLDALGKLSDRLGDVPMKIEALQFAAEQSGISAEEFAKSVEKLQKNLGDVVLGTGQAKFALKALGLTVGEVLARRPSEQIRLLADAFGKLPTQAEKSSAAAQLFGRSGLKMVKLLDEGSSGVDNLTGQFAKLGPVMDRNAIAKVEEANDAMNRSKTSIKLMAEAFAVSLSPAIVATSNSLTKFISDAAGARKSGISTLRLFGDEAAKKLPFLSSLVGVTNSGEKERLQKLLAEPITQAQIAANKAAAQNQRTARVRNAQRLRDVIAQKNAETAANVARIAQQKAEAEMTKNRIALEKEAARIFSQTRTPEENLKVRLDRLRELLKKGVINKDTFSRALANAQASIKPIDVKVMADIGPQSLEARRSRLLTGRSARTNPTTNLLREARKRNRLLDRLIRESNQLLRNGERLLEETRRLAGSAV